MTQRHPKTLRWTIVRATVLAFFCAAATATAGAQTTWHVVAGAALPGNGTPVAPFASIQAAIISASSQDTVLVAAGTYVEHLDFLGKDLIVSGAQGAGIQGAVTGMPIVRFTGGESAAAVLEGFTIELGVGGTEPYQAGMGGEGQPGGILIDGASPTIRRCVIRDCLGGDGGFVGGNGVSPVRAGDGGPGAILARQSSSLIEDCRIESNRGGRGGDAVGFAPAAGGNGGCGGIRIEGPVTLRRCRVNNNNGFVAGRGVSADGRGGTGGAEVHATGAIVDSCLLDQNFGGVQIGSTPVGRGGAGGIGVWAGGFVLVNTSLRLNLGMSTSSSAHPGGAGAVFFGAGGGGSIVHCTMVSNSTLDPAASSDGIQGLGAGALTIANSILYFTASGPAHPTILWSPSSATLIVESCDVEGGWPGPGNIDVTPLFESPFTVAQQLRLAAISPLVDAGDPAYAAGLATDMEGEPRILGSGPDIGMDEAYLASSGSDFRQRIAVGTTAPSIAHALAAPGGAAIVVETAGFDSAFAGALGIIAAQLFPAGTGPTATALFPSLHLNPGATAILSSYPEGPSSTTLSGVIPVGLLGSALRVQTIVLAPASANGIFETTIAQDLIFE
jgi:hypothetical protein